MGDWRPDRILKLLIFWITYLLVFSWLPLMRILMDGESYQWGTTHFGRVFRANTMSGDAWLLVAKSAFLVLLLYLGLRGAGAAFRVLLVTWNLAFAADVLHGYMVDPNGLEFHGDTLGIHLNLGLSVVAVAAAFALLAVYWVVWRAPGGAPQSTPPWTTRNRRLLTVFFLIVPIQFVLLRFGEPHGTTDAIGVLFTIAQCPLLAAALSPWSSRAS